MRPGFATVRERPGWDEARERSLFSVSPYNGGQKGWGYKNIESRERGAGSG